MSVQPQLQPTQNILDSIISPKIIGNDDGYSIKTDIHNVDNIVIDGTIGSSGSTLKLSSTLDLNGQSLINIDDSHFITLGDLQIKTNELSSTNGTIKIASQVDLNGNNLISNTGLITIGDSSVNTAVVHGNLKTDQLTFLSGNEAKTTFTTDTDNTVILDGGAFKTNDITAILNLNAGSISSTGIVSGVTGTFTSINAGSINITGKIELGPDQSGNVLGSGKCIFTPNIYITDSSIVSLQTPTKYTEGNSLSITSVISNLITYTGGTPFQGQQILGTDGDIFPQGTWYANPTETGKMYLTDYPGGPSVYFDNKSSETIPDALLTGDDYDILHTLISSSDDTITYTGDTINNDDLVKTFLDPDGILPNDLLPNTIYIAYESSTSGSKTIKLKTYPGIQSLPNYNIEGPMSNALYTIDDPNNQFIHTTRDITDITTYTIQYNGLEIVNGSTVYVVQSGSTTSYRASNSSFDVDHGSIVINPVYTELTGLSTYDETTPYYDPVPNAISGRTLVRILSGGQIVYGGNDFTQYDAVTLSDANLPRDSNDDPIGFPGGLDQVDYVIYSVGTTTIDGNIVKIITLAEPVEITIGDFNILPVLDNVIVIDGSTTRSITDITSNTITYTGDEIVYGTELKFLHGVFPDFSDGLDGDLFIAVSVEVDYQTGIGQIQIRPLPLPVTIGYYGALENVLQIQTPGVWPKLTYTLIPGRGFAIYTEDGSDLPETLIYWFIPLFTTQTYNVIT